MNTTINTIPSAVGMIIAAVAIAASIGFVGLTWSQNQAQAITNQAVHDCMTAAQSTWNTSSEENSKTINNTVVEPNADWYQTCLTDKGIAK